MSTEVVRIEDRLHVQHLEQLMNWFQLRHLSPSMTAATSRNSKLSSKRRHKTRESYTLRELRLHLQTTLGSQSSEAELDNLFTRLNLTGEGHIDWNDICTYILVHLRENDFMRTNKAPPIIVEPKIRQIKANRLETTSRVFSIQNPTKFITISKTGAMCVWNVNMHVEKFYQVFASDGGDGVDVGQAVSSSSMTGATRRRVHEWVTDAVYLSNCHRIAIASTGRDIRFFDTATSTQFYEECCLYALPDVPSCFDYSFDPKNSDAESLLLFGDDHGVIHLLYFSKPLTQLFDIPFNKEEGTTKIYFPDLNSHCFYVRYAKIDTYIVEPIRMLLFQSDNNSVAFATSHQINSLVIADVQSKRKSYVFSVAKGVDCFDYNKNLNVLATGSSDHLVRLWNPYVTNHPTAILKGHLMSIVDVKICEELHQVFSYSRDTVLKVWDIHENTCLQSVGIKFPFSSGVISRLPEFGPFSLHLHLSTMKVLVTTNDYIAMLKLGRSNHINSNVVTHAAQLSCVVYNSLYQQIITAADDSTVIMWDLMTGCKKNQISSAHGTDEITAMSVDNSQHRLITGARNGSIKIWNAQNGHNLHNLEAVDDQEVTGIVSLDDKRMVIGVGWSRKIIQYHIEQDTVLAKADCSWKGGNYHLEDILAIDFCPPHALATASFDGDIAIWSLDTEKLVKTLRRTNPECRSLPVAAVDRLLFLKSRARNKQPTLISSEAGSIRWWSIYGKTQDLGSFRATNKEEEFVLGLCANDDNSLLFCGDTGGKVSVWDISNYCLRPSQSVNDAAVRLHMWSAHISAPIVSIACAEHCRPDNVIYIISASTDMTARLWLIDGTPIGTFGQVSPWDLTQPTTWRSNENVAEDKLTSDLNIEETEADSNLKRSDSLERVADEVNCPAAETLNQSWLPKALQPIAASYTSAQQIQSADKNRQQMLIDGDNKFTRLPSITESNTQLVQLN